MMDSQTLRSCALMQFAVREGIVSDYGLSEILQEPIPTGEVPADIFDVVRETAERAGVNETHYELYSAAKTRQHQESALPPVTNPDETQAFAVELARIAVPEGHIGFVTNISQVVYDEQGDVYPSGAAFWGSPYSIDAEIASCRWFFTIEYFDGVLPPRFQVNSLNPITFADLPGTPWREMPTIDAMWYPAHNVAGQNLKLLVPTARILRFFFSCQTTGNYNFTAAGKLSGFTQTVLSDDSAENARRGW